MMQSNGFSQKIIRVYVLGTGILLVFFLSVFHAGILLTENAMMERRIALVAPFHFERYAQGDTGMQKVDPVLTLFDEHAQLPSHIQSKISPDWTGSTHLLLDDEREFQVLARRVTTGDSTKVVYAVEDSNLLEWDDTQFALTELSLALVGVALFLATSAYMVRAARRIASPFLYIAQQMETESIGHFEPINPPGERSTELTLILSALNAYRARLKDHIDREQSFTRYVSHELRTPLMVLKGAISNLKRVSSPSHEKPVSKIIKATDQMQDMVQTFLMLARDSMPKDEECRIDDSFLSQVLSELQTTVSDNHIDFRWQLQTAFCVRAHPQLVKAVVHNLLKNAFACSVDGHVSLFVTPNGMEIIDDGVGLSAKPRGYEGFGIGLVLVQDVCDKYGWRFSLQNNSDKGCTAKVEF